MAPVIIAKDLYKCYAGFSPVLRGVNIEVEAGELVAIMGPSGCGKSTMLHVLGMLHAPDSGTLEILGTNVLEFNREQTAAFRRGNMGFVMQSSNMFDHSTVFENVEFPLIYENVPPAERWERVIRALELVRLSARVHYRSNRLSGGEQQRVAIARAIVSEPRLLLLDEPLSNLDAKLRVDMRSELKRLHHETGSTIIYVTHDQVEALTMSTRIALFRHGELVQVAPPLELYDNPCNLYTADFIGNPSINFVKVKGKAAQAGLTVDGVLGTMSFPREDMTTDAPTSGDLDITLGVRPEQIVITRQRTAPNQVEGKVYSGMPAGSETLVSVQVGDAMLTVKELGSTHYSGDETVYLTFNPKKINVFDAKSEKLIKYSL